MRKKSLIAGFIAGIVSGVVISAVAFTYSLDVCDYVYDKDLEWAVGGMNFPNQLNWMNDALSANQDLVWKYAHYEECVNTFLEELDSIYNIQDMYPGYLQDAEDEVALQWAKADE